MPKFIIPFLLATSSWAAQAAQLTEAETRWLQAASPVLAYAKQQQLPIDIIVQPQARPGDVPLAMGFDGGRCKLVLSLRGNPDAEAALAAVPPAQQGLAMEAMAAHEIGHCWRQAQGVWHQMPSGFQEATLDPAQPPEIRQLARELLETQREEGYADLVALAWVQHSRPADYARAYTWLRGLRAAQPAEHISHDTSAWLALAADGAAFAAGGTPFEQARALWSKGLAQD